MHGREGHHDTDAHAELWVVDAPQNLEEMEGVDRLRVSLPTRFDPERYRGIPHPHQTQKQPRGAPMGMTRLPRERT